MCSITHQPFHIPTHFFMQYSTMKRYLLPFFILLTSYSIAQEPVDALRYSRFTPVGSARSMAIGGALTGLGGDISSVLVNPAGIGLFKTNELVLSPGLNLYNNKTDYLGQDQKQTDNAFNLGTTGIIFSNGGMFRQGRGWKNFTFALSATRTANFNNRVIFEGLNNQSSYSEKYLEELIGDNVTDPNKAARDYPFGSSLAVNTFLVEPVLNNQGDATGYFSLATPQSGVTQQQVIDTRGGITTYSIAGAGNLNDKFYIGGSLNFESLRYTRTQTFRESDATDINNDFNYFSVEDYLDTRGSGINLKAGMIFKPMEQLRLGVSVHTPTLYDMSDSYNTTITTDLEGYQGNGVLTQSSRDLLGQFGEFAYQFVNPWRFTAGIAYVLREVQDVTKQKGFLTADVEFVNYGRGKFSDPDNVSGNFFDELNSVVRNQYRNAINVRLGGELKFNTIMVRGGFGYFSNPYKDPELDGMRMNISGGLGWRNKGKFIDLTYIHQIVNDGFYPYRLNDNFFAPVNMGGSVGNVMMTFGFKF